MVLSRGDAGPDPQLMTHLERCAECAAEYKDLCAVVRLLATVMPDGLEDDCPDGD